jgi:hypothetical protein
MNRPEAPRVSGPAYRTQPGPRPPADKQRRWVTRRRCHRSTVPGVISRCIRSLAGSSRISAARTTRLGHSSRERGFVRRSTATSCRSTSRSTSLEARERPSRTRQPESRTRMRYISRRDTADHHGLPPTLTLAHCCSSETRRTSGTPHGRDPPVEREPQLAMTSLGCSVAPGALRPRCQRILAPDRAGSASQMTASCTFTTHKPQAAHQSKYHMGPNVP